MLYSYKLAMYIALDSNQNFRFIFDFFNKGGGGVNPVNYLKTLSRVVLCIPICLSNGY